MPTTTINTKFFTITQNNSGGYFDHEPEYGIGYALCVEALDEVDAEARMRRIIDNYGPSGSCPCCGDRWSIYFWRDDASEEPSLYGQPLRGSWGISSYIHYMDGRIEARSPDYEPA